MKKLIVLCLSLSLFFSTVAYAQGDIESEEPLTVEEQLESLLADLSSLQKSLKKNRRKRPVAREIKTITKKIIKAVNSIPPESCMNTIRQAMKDFYDLVSELQLGIACGPLIIPPFLPGGDEPILEKINVDCLPPDDLLQIGGPFGGAFVDVNPLYDEAKDLFQIDSDESEISDVCEGEVE